jgi:sulfatase modifying factor 1
MKKPSTHRFNKLILAVIVFIAAMLILFFFTSHHAQKIMIGNGTNGPRGMVRVPGGEFLMGSNLRLAKNNEKPAHLVRVSGFWIDQTDVTNAQFAVFVKATGYITTAEKKPDWETLKVQLPPSTPKAADDKLVPGAMVFVGTPNAVPLNDNSRWWHFVPGANWQHPKGPDSSIVGKEDHPVVQVSYEDALAYAKWAGKRLPTEAEWEYAARGGVEQTNYIWGDELTPQGKTMANTFAGKTFPVVPPGYEEKIGTTKVASYPPNRYQLYDMAGNVWQWVTDWYRADAFAVTTNDPEPTDPSGPTNSFDPADQYTPADAPNRVIRGGSFLCDENFCTSYRPSARRGVDPYNPMSHIGFRLVMTDKMAREHAGVH